MKSTVNKLDGLVHKLNIEVPADKVSSAFDKVYKGIQKNATIKGFRKGKAPLATIRAAYSDRVRQDVLNDLISDSYQSALAEHSLEPVGYPKIHFEDFIEDGAFVYTAEFEVRPQIELKKFENLEVEKEILNIEDKRVDEVLENIRQSQASAVPVLEDRGAILGDIAEIDFEGFVDGAPLENGSAQNRPLELGSARFIPGFEDGLVGMKPGEQRELNLQFPADYHAAVAGKPVLFKIKLNALKKKSLPELNDELAARSGSYKTMDEFRAAIRKDIEDSEQKRIRDDLRNRVLKALVKNNPVQTPQGLLQQQKEMIINDVKGRMSEQGMNEQEFEEYKQKWDKDFEQSAAFMVQSTFLVDTLADKLNLRATAADVEAKIDEYAKQTGIEREKVAEFYDKQERKSRLFFQITEERVVAYLLDKAKIKEVAKDKLSDPPENN
ncbi:MAG: trigger factor [Bdellovibrionales bacterium]